MIAAEDALPTARIVGLILQTFGQVEVPRLAIRPWPGHAGYRPMQLAIKDAAVANVSGAKRVDRYVSLAVQECKAKAVSTRWQSG